MFDLDDNAHVHHEWFGRTVIHSDYRFTYDEAKEVIEKKEGNMAEYVLPAHQLAQILRKQRMDNHAINFETEEVKFILDEKGKPVGVYLKKVKKRTS